jgi:hypothetical protein
MAAMKGMRGARSQFLKQATRSLGQAFDAAYKSIASTTSGTARTTRGKAAKGTRRKTTANRSTAGNKPKRGRRPKSETMSTTTGQGT